MLIKKKKRERDFLVTSDTENYEISFQTDENRKKEIKKAITLLK